MLQIKNLGTEKTVPDNSDFLPIQEAAGTTRHITRSNFLAGINNSGGSPLKYIQLLDTRPNGTAGGTPVVNAWTNRIINSLAIDQLATTTLANNIFTLDAGTYVIDCTTSYYKCNFIRTRLFNVTNNSPVANVLSINGYNAAEACSFSLLKGRFILSDRQALSIQYRVSANGGYTGLGEPCSFGKNEIFLLANIWKL